MRFLPADLLAAQQASSGAPFVRTVVLSGIRDMNHLRFNETYQAALPDDEHDAVADASSLHRVRVNGGNAQYEKNAGGGWTTLSSAADCNHVAIAAVNDQRVIVVYNRGAALYFRESTDQPTPGTFGPETLILATAATPTAVAVAYKNTGGDLAVFWAEGAALKRVRRAAGSFGSAASWTQSANSINGLDVEHFGDFHLVLTGADTDGRPTLWSLILGDGVEVAADTWTQFFAQNQAEADESITFQAPFLEVIDTHRITYVEKFSGSPAYTRTYWTMIQSGANYSPGHWEWMDPVPLDNESDFGYAVTAGVTSPSTVFYSRPGQVLEASSAVSTLDMSADLIEATVEERDGLAQRAELVFDNSNGQYAGPPAPIAIHHDVDLGLGYDALFSKPPGQSIVGWEYRRRGGVSAFVLHTRGVDYWLARFGPRTTIVDTGTMTQIARGAAGRAGLEFSNIGASSRASTLNLTWTIHPHQSHIDILRALIAIMPDLLITNDVSRIAIFEPKATDSIDYSYGTDHAVYQSHTREQPAASVAEILGEGVLGQAFDFEMMDQDKPLQDRRRDPHAALLGEAQDHAAARLRKAILEQDLGYLITPPNCGLQTGDVIAYTDLLVSASQLTARVRSIQTRFRRAGSGPALYEQRIGLGGV